MPITNTTNHIKFEYIVGDDKGNIEVNPFRLEDAYNEDLVNGWGVISKTGNLYYINKGILVEGNTHFRMEQETLQVLKPLENNIIINFIPGESGSVFITRSNLHFDGTSYQMTFRNNTIIENSKIDYCQIINLYSAYSDKYATIRTSLISCQQIAIRDYATIEDCELIDCDYTFRIQNKNININNNKLIDCTHSIYRFNSTEDYTIRGIDTNNNANIAYYPNGLDNTATIIDSRIKSNTIYVLSPQSVTNGITIFKQSLRFKCGDDINVLIKDVSNNIILDKTLNNNDIEEITYTIQQVKSDNVDGSFVLTTNEVNILEPFTVEISKNGYETFIINNFYVTDENSKGNLYPIDIVAELKKSKLYITDVIISGTSRLDENDGSLEIIAEGGYGNYEYSLDGINYQENNIFNELYSGEYVIYVKDENDTITTFNTKVYTDSKELFFMFPVN